MSIFRALFLFFVVLPLVELVLLYRLGLAYGFLPTLAVVLLVGAVGASIAKRVGLSAFADWNQRVAEGRVPEDGVLDALLLLGAGVFFVMPGVLSDVLGLVLLFPPTRKLVAAAIRRRFERGMTDGSVEFVSFGAGGFSARTRGAGGAVPPGFPGARGGFPRGGRASAGDIVDVVGEDVTSADGVTPPALLPPKDED